MLIFSCMVSGVSAVFLSHDNEIIFASPAPLSDLYLMRYLTTTFYTSWMMVIFSLPIFGAYGRIFEAGPLYLLLLVPTVIAIATIANGIGLAVTIILVRLFPARRTKDIVVYLSLLFGILLYLVIRLLRPEELADPERFPDFIEYLSRMSTPATPLLPPSWAADLLTGYLQDHTFDWLLAALLLLTPAVVYFAGEWIMARMFFSGFSKAQESFGGSRRFRPRPYRPSPMLWFFRKELKMFIRDSSQWSQLFLIGALVVVYLYNFKVLPLERSPIPADAVANIIAYANIGLTGFIVASLCARFVYPAIGSEGSAFGLILTAPLSIRRYLLYKYLFYFIPFTILSADPADGQQPPAPDHRAHVVDIPDHRADHHLDGAGPGPGFRLHVRGLQGGKPGSGPGGFGAILFLFTAIAFELLTILAAGIPAYRLVRSWRWGLHFASPIMAQTAGTLLLIVLAGGLISVISLRKGMEKMADNFH